MSYAIHDTEGILLDDRSYGEAGRLLFILSKDHGFMTLLAVGVREQKSKLRHLLSVGSIAIFEFVEGKEVKRLTSLFPILRYEDMFLNLSKRNVFSHLVNFISKNILGDIDADLLYVDFLAGLDFLEANQNEKQNEQIEIIMIINLLSNLGYWEKGENLDFTDESFEYINNNKDKLINKINKSIQSTQI